MITYTRVRNTFSSNPKGILNACLTYNIQDVVKSNTRLYFYRFNVYDLVEIDYYGDESLLCVYDFAHTEDRAETIKDNIEFFHSYFKSAGLCGKRFLFNVVLKTPVTYEDFVPMQSIKSFVDDSDFAFILDRKAGYVCEVGSVNLFRAYQHLMNIDKLVLSFYNDMIGLKRSKFRHQSIFSNGLIFILSGLLNGLDIKSIKDEIPAVEVSSRFKTSIETLDFNSSHVESSVAKLKSDKFKKILKNINNNVLATPKREGNEVYLRDIIDIGLDKYVRELHLANPNKAVPVELDCEWQTIKSMYICKGAAFITPTTNRSIDYFIELLSSENVVYVLH